MLSPISTNSSVTRFRDPGKYANMILNKAHRMPESYTDLYVTESVDCPFHYTEGCKSFRTRENIERLGDTALSLVWNGQVGSYSHRRDVAHGQGGNQGIFLVLRPDLRRI
jgi:hypothetical protein